MTCGIYCFENLINGKKYVGRTSDIPNRLSSHKSHLKKNTDDSILLQKAWNKYGEKIFSFYVIEECDKEKLNEREIYYIKEWNTKTPNGYNCTDGGGGSINPSLSTRKKMSESQTGIKNPRFGIKLKSSSSEYFGVQMVPSGKWTFSLYENKIKIRSKLYEIEEEAARAYDEYVVRRNLPNPLNFPLDKK